MQLKSAANALIKSKGRLPPERAAVCLDICREFLGHEPSGEELASCAAMDPKQEVDGYVAREVQVVNSLNTEDNELDVVKVENFVREWRKVLVESLNPQHLPPCWSIDGQVFPHNG